MERDWVDYSDLGVSKLCICNKYEKHLFDPLPCPVSVSSAHLQSCCPTPASVSWSTLYSSSVIVEISVKVPLFIYRLVPSPHEFTRQLGWSNVPLYFTSLQNDRFIYDSTSAIKYSIFPPPKDLPNKLKYKKSVHPGLSAAGASLQLRCQSNL